LRVITVNTKTLAALSHVISSCLAPNQLQFHDHIVIAHGAECTGIKYQGNYKSHHSSSPNTALELKNEHPFEGNGRRHELPIRISRVRGWDNAGTLNASVCSLTNRTLRCSPATACGPVTSGYGGGSDSLDNLLRLPAHCEPLFAQLETVNEHYLRLKHVLLVIQNRARGYRYGALTTHIRARSGHLVAEIGFKGKHLLAHTELHEIKGEHLFAETEIKGEHLFAETGIKGEHLFAETEIKGEHLFAETGIKGEHLFAETGIKGEHLFAETEIKGEHLLAETEIKGEHLFAETEAKGEHLFAETGIKGEHLFAETGAKGEHLFAETGIKGEHLFAETEIKAKKAGWQE
jgi:hypothetical protein